MAGKGKGIRWLLTEWLKRENDDAVRDLLIDALQRTSIPFSADALLDVYKQSNAGAAHLAKVGWLPQTNRKPSPVSLRSPLVAVTIQLMLSFH
jgi:hypothetical protein